MFDFVHERRVMSERKVFKFLFLERNSDILQRFWCVR